ncbi:telomerase protein component 1-like [Uloborus diversus]|uniref:telomerase protein component 1-like n=1 Tax=Uloborus diversus TaxID=327109 RepID=UPI0024090957|nr:telomerase protein component 1-like [Uloborus diversus]
MQVQEINEMPSYNFKLDTVSEVKQSSLFLSLDEQPDALQLKNAQKNKLKKIQLLNITSLALMYSANLKSPCDEYRLLLKKCADDVRQLDPEFILKVALYARQELHIRSVANFLLSYAAFYESTRIFLEKYFKTSIVLPSDWIDVGEHYQVLAVEAKKKCFTLHLHTSFPSALRKVLKNSFSKFDEYQLAKYNRTKKKKTQVLREKENLTENEDEQKMELPRTFTLKQLIRVLHISAPADKVMCLLGKKYPSCYQDFQSSGLPGNWDSSKAGQRMKLPVPETWETQISAYGNNPAVWESLIDSSKLPYMATLRNVKNLILSGISPKHHEKVLKYLGNKNAVLKSRQFPTQYYEAYKSLVVLEDMLKKNEANELPEKPEKSVPFWLQKQKEKMLSKIQNASLKLLQNYKKTISAAVEISALHNLQPIPGKTLVICEISNSMIKNLRGKRQKLQETCLLTGLMCLRACEDCKMTILLNFEKQESIVLNECDQFLEVVMNVCEKFKCSPDEVFSYSKVPLENILYHYLRPATMYATKLDHIILMRTGASDTVCADIRSTMWSFLHKYRVTVNPELLYTDVDFCLRTMNFPPDRLDSEKDVYICGGSNQLIKFIAQRSSGGQLTCVENIDTKYGLLDVSKPNRRFQVSNKTEEQTISPLAKIPKWHTVRIFISSTFKDMHSERDLLIKFVMPELQRRAASIFIRINEVDLRWGISESGTENKRAAELCLLEAQNSDLFIGIVGGRYGTLYNFGAPDSPTLDWVTTECEWESGLSITALEMRAFSMKNPEWKAFCYLRDGSFARGLPTKWKSYFVDEDENLLSKLEKFKSVIRKSGVKVFNGYPCQFAGILKGKPILSGLETFGSTVIEDVWNALKRIHDENPCLDEVAEEDMNQVDLFDSHQFCVGEKNSCIGDVLSAIQSDSEIVVMFGSPGSGKTSTSVQLLKKLENYPIIKYFIGGSPQSKDLSYMLHYICNSIVKQFPVSAVFPQLASDIINQFPDILNEAVSSTGCKNLILLIDGLDHLELESQRLDWLPLSLPKGLKLICTTSDSSHALKVLSERKSHGCSIAFQSVNSLQKGDREKLVREYLYAHGKKLDESSFNNQMLLLVTKKESDNPFYLKLACDFLRTYATFETFLSMLQRLPTTVSMLLDEIILQMENEFGTLMMQTALTLLCITKEGIEDLDFHIILSYAVSTDRKTSSVEKMVNEILAHTPENFIPHVTYCSMMHLIGIFAFGNSRHRCFTLIGTEFEKAVRKFYMNKNYDTYSDTLHSVLAAYYKTNCDPQNNGSWSGSSRSALRNLLHHLYNGFCYHELAEYLCCHKFLEAVFRLNAADSILGYYSSLLSELRQINNKTKGIDAGRLLQFSEFVSRNIHIFHQYPQLVVQQAMNEPKNSAVLLQQNSSTTSTFECLSRSSLVDFRLATFSGFLKNIISIGWENNQPYAVLGSEDGYLKVLDISSRKMLRTIKGHSSAISFVCFAGKNRICLSSADTTLSIWNVENFSRIAVLKGHRDIVTCCCADPDGSILFSSGWDNSIRLWSLHDGRPISVFDDFKCPVNCVAHHPYKQNISSGLWNGYIEIWDTVSMTKKLSFHGNNGSVKTIAYTPDGHNIITSFIHSDIIIWSSELGLKISSLKGHVLPVKSLSISAEMFISGSDDGTLKVWSSEPGICSTNSEECKSCPIKFLEFVSINHLAVVFQNSSLWIIDVNNGHVICKENIPSEQISCVAKNSSYATDRVLYSDWFYTSVIVGMESGNIIVWNFFSSTTTLVGNIGSRVTAIIQNRSIIFCGAANGDIGMFTYPELMHTKIINRAHNASITTLFCKDKSEDVILVSTSTDKGVNVWLLKEIFDNMDVDLLAQYSTKHKDYVTAGCFMELLTDETTDVEGESFLTGSCDNNIIYTKGDYNIVFKGLQTSVNHVGYANDCIFGCGIDGSIIVWSVDGRVLSSVPGINQSSAVLAYCIDRDSTNKLDVLLAFVDKDGSVKIRKSLQKSFWYSLHGHSKGITSCCLDDSGEILSCSLDGTVNLWKTPFSAPGNSLIHATAITSVLFSSECDVILSSDTEGNVVLWKVSLSSKGYHLIYVTKKTYPRSYIKCMALLKDNTFAVAYTQYCDSEDKYFLDILQYDSVVSLENMSYSLHLKTSYELPSETMCMDSCNETNTLLAGLKSGELVSLINDVKATVSVSTDWILGVCIFSRNESKDSVCVSLLKGLVKYFSFSDKQYKKVIDLTEASSFTPYAYSICYDGAKRILIGDALGYLWICGDSSLESSAKIHTDAITGVCVVGDYIFTSSLDKTVKGWHSTSLEQACQFHSSAPVTSITSSGLFDSDKKYILVIGTTSGEVHLLKYQPT